MPHTKLSHPIFARVYAWAGPRMERAGFGRQRDRVLAGLTGRVIEVGAGDGMNFAHYPPGVTQVVAVEPEPYLRHVAERRAARAPVDVAVVAGLADGLPAEDGSFDAAVASLVLCSVPDPAAALAEMRRVLRPGGELRFFEHVRAGTPGLARVQRALDATIWPHVTAGCHTGRDTGRAIEAAGFRIEQIERFRLPDTRITTPTATHIRGMARRPA